MDRRLDRLEERLRAMDGALRLRRPRPRTEDLSHPNAGPVEDPEARLRLRRGQNGRSRD